MNLTTVRRSKHGGLKIGSRVRRSPPAQRLTRCVFLSAIISIAAGSYFAAGPDEPNTRSDACSVVLVPAFEKKIALTTLEQALKSVAAKPKLRAGVFAIEPSSGCFVDIDGHESFSAASLIKIPVLVKLLDCIDRGEVSLDEILELRPDLIGGGSGYLQWRSPNSKVSLKEAMEAMIVVSDNTATNLIIDRVGGIESCNRDFAFWGLTRTYLNDWLPDLPGTNKTSPSDLVTLLALVDKGDLLSTESRERMMKIMERTRTKTLLPQGLAPGAKIFHKTGDIGSLVGDAGIITTPEGRRFIAAVQVERPHNDRRANETIRQISRLMYKTFAGLQSGPVAESTELPSGSVRKKFRS